MTGPQQDEPLLAAAAKATDEEPHYLHETALCLNCGLGLERIAGHVTPRGTFARWKHVGDDDWRQATRRHATTWLRECDPQQVTYHRRQQAATSEDAAQ